MVMFLVVKSTYIDSNFRFDVDVAYLWLIIFSVVDDVSINSDTLMDRLHESQGQTGPVFQKCS
jgi:hypothetical protein